MFAFKLMTFQFEVMNPHKNYGKTRFSITYTVSFLRERPFMDRKHRDTRLVGKVSLRPRLPKNESVVITEAFRPIDVKHGRV